MYRESRKNMAKYTKQEYDGQKRMLKNIYDEPMFSPLFHWNEKYLTDELKDTYPYISINDLCDYKYVICAIPREKVKNPPLMEFNRHIVVKEYGSLDELVEDDWRLD